MGLFDVFFRRKPTAPPTKPSGTDGTYTSGGYLISYEQKDELRGKTLYTTYTNLIANTTIAGASVRYFQNLVGGTQWTITPKEGAGADGERAADIVREGLIEANMRAPWHTVVKKASLFRFYGFSAHEWVIRKRPDGMIVFDEIAHRPQHTIEAWDMVAGQPGFQGILQRAFGLPDYFYVPRERLFYCVDNSLTDSPDGVGMLRHVVEHARRLVRYEQLEGFGYETDLRGMPVGRIPYAELNRIAQKENKPKGWVATQTAPMEALIANHIKTPFQGIALDSETYRTDSASPTISPVPKWALELMTSRTEGLGDIHNVIERINREIARVLGMEFLLLGGDGKGSLALSRDKTSMFASLLEATLNEIAWFTVHDLVYPLLELNGLDPEECCPQVMPDPIATERIEVVVDALQKLALAGAVMQPDDPAINQIRQRLHLADQPKLSPAALAGLRPQNKQPAPPGKDPKAGPPDPGKGEVDVDLEDAKDGADDAKPTKPRATKGTFRRRPAGG